MVTHELTIHSQQATKHSMDLVDLTSAQKADIEHLAVPGTKQVGFHGASHHPKKLQNSDQQLT